MPKVYSEEERAQIDRRLREEATYCLGAFGVKGTTVDLLVKRVNIPKGTFYLFYESKELLLFRAMLELHEQMEAALIEHLEALPDKRDVYAVTDAIVGLYQVADRSGMLRMMTTGEMDLIYRKLPNEVLAEHMQKDADMTQLIFDILGIANEGADAYAAAFRSQFITMLYKHEVGDEKAFGALRLCIRGLVLQLFEAQ